MHRLIALSLFAAPLLLACSQQDPPPHFIDVTYQVRCVDCQPLTVDNETHKVLAIDGEDNYVVGCTAHGNAPLVTFSAKYTAADKKNSDQSYSIKVAEASLAGRDPGKACAVSVTEGPNSYQGDCTADLPTDDSPCQVKLKRDGDHVSGSIYCKHIQNRSTNASTRYVVKPGTTKPFTFEVDGCEGL